MPKLEQPQAEHQHKEDAHEFADFDPYGEDDSSQATEEGEPGQEASTEGKATPPPAQTPPPEDPVYEVPGIGQIRASEIKGLKAKEATFSSIQSDYEKLQADQAEVAELYDQLSGLAHWKDLLDVKEIRDDIQQILVKRFQDPSQLSSGDGKGQEFLHGLGTRRNPQSPQAPSEADTRMQAMEAQLATFQLKDYFAGLGHEEGNADIVTPQFIQAVKDTARVKFADKADSFGLVELDLVARSMLAIEKMNRMGKNGAPALPPGVRLVPAGATRNSATTPKLPDPRKMNESQMVDDFVNWQGVEE